MSPPQRVLNPPFLRLLAVSPFTGFAICVFYLLPKYLATELHATPSQIGLVGFVYGGASILAIPLLAVHTDRGRTARELLLVGAAMLSASALGFLAVTA